jgi:hypothetical protein
MCIAPDKRWENVRDNLGYVVRIARKLNLAEIAPRDTLSSTGYCLAHEAAKGAQYLVYTPTGGAFTVNLSAMPGSRQLKVEWFNPATGAEMKGTPVPAGSTKQVFTPPFAGDAVLILTDAAAGRASGGN